MQVPSMLHVKTSSSNPPRLPCAQDSALWDSPFRAGHVEPKQNEVVEGMPCHVRPQFKPQPTSVLCALQGIEDAEKTNRRRGKDKTSGTVTRALAISCPSLTPS
ncbi:hypothetical protein G6O67_001944 [Ophiocordyceps sinensis]|uniref:Uncharacterized protein n=1 Tax=Ophiocordyceps sinensis TaxID=72228 RepID=A0A8H4V6S1_9HYPO|nr:hypothetical protein G6O67_001944 [Ophiocordyceps sinensis]